MTSEPEIPRQFGSSWETFVSDWCCGGSLAYSVDETTRALSTVNRLWPEHIAGKASERTRGLAVVAPIVELGILLGACEPVEGFSNVLKRLRDGERSAYSELVLVSSLRRLGYTTRLEPPLNGNVLDAVTEVDGLPIYFEVVAPDRSGESSQDQKLIDNLIGDIKAVVSKCRVEIEISSPIDPNSIAAVIATIQAAPPSTWVQVKSLARIRRIDVSQKLLPTFDGEGVQMNFGGEVNIQGESTSVVARLEDSDSRAKRILRREYHHFLPDVRNLLVVNVSAVSGGMTLWPETMAKLLRPTQNRKIGAIALFDQGCVGPPDAIRRRWRVVTNSHAHLSVPEELVVRIESLDESRMFGLPRPQRIVAC